MHPRTVLPLLLLVLLIQGHPQAALAQPATPTPRTYATATNLLYRAEPDATEAMRNRCRLDVYHPVGAREFATVVWFHGGGLTGGNRFVPEALKRHGIAIVAANYRLSPHATAPAYIEDAAAAVAWTFRNIAAYGGSTNRIFVAGHSAGGYLTSMLGLDKRWLAAQGIDADSLAGLIPYSGQCVTHFTVRAERGIPRTRPIIDDLAPLYHVRQDAPPLLMITGDRSRELLGRYEENAYLWRMMKEVGHTGTELLELQGYDHGQMVEPGHPLLLRFIAARGTPAPKPGEDRVLADFEGDTYGSWVTTGDAFGPGPARGTLPGQMRVDGFQGRGLVSSFHQGDASTGTLTSPPFTVDHPFLSFLVGGGRDPVNTCMHLLVDGRIVRTTTGPNDKPGGTEALAPDSWDVSEFRGRTAVLRIVDSATGGWGHINIDHIVLTDRRPPGTVTNATRDFLIGKRYLNLPIRNGAPRRRVTTLVDGQVAVRNDIELADGDPDWWAPMDVSAWPGRTVTLSVDRLPGDSRALDAIEPSDSLRDAADLYQEAARGQFHFSARRGWNNDPNGLVFFNGEYHMFFQHNPYGWGWGNMHWGHAVSRDLVHWTELGDVLSPDTLGPMFSGSAVVDWKNTSGLGSDGHPPLVLIYTAAGDPTVQCIASSTDGRTFTKFPGNPVLKQITGGNRDPKVTWHEPTKRWVMVLYVELEKRHTVHFLTSPNLRDWTLASITDGIAGSSFLYECPDFFELPVDGDSSRKMWVLTAANSEYAVGSFDGTRFTPAPGLVKLPGHRGRGFYAAQTFSDIPAEDGRRIQIGWFQTETRGMPFNQSMTVPLELRLTSTPEGPRLTYTPARELESLRTRTWTVPAARLEPGIPSTLAGVASDLLEIRAEFEPGDATEVAFLVRGASVVYDAKKQELSVNGHRAPAPLIAGTQRLIIYCDRTGLEVFTSDGRTYVPMPFLPKAKDLRIAVEARGGGARLNRLRIHELGSAWRLPDPPAP